MKAFLIDPESQTITKLDFSGDEAMMHALLGNRILEVVPQTFNGSLGEKYDALYVGDFRPEGSTEEPEHWFLLDVYPVSGRAVVLGIAEDGGDCDASIHLEDLIERITWAQYRLQFQERNVEARRQH